jgi:glutathione S-transferase
LPAEREDAAYRQIDRALSWMEDALDPGPWLLGDVYSLADIAMAPYINRVEVLDRPESIAHEARPRLAAWWRRIQERPAYREAMAFRNPDPGDPVNR